MQTAVKMFVLGLALIWIPFWAFRYTLFHSFFVQHAGTLIPPRWFLAWFILVQTAGILLLAHLISTKDLVISFFSGVSIACSSLMILIVGWMLLASPAGP